MTWLLWAMVLLIPLSALSAISDYRRGNLPGVWCLVVMLFLSAAAVRTARDLITTYGA